MRQTLSQNIDTPKPNPLMGKLPKLPKPSIKLPKNPKIIALIILAITIFLLLIANFLIKSPPSTKKNNQNTISQNLPSPTSTPNPIPTQFVDQFSQIEQLLEQNITIDPPQIDSQIGL